MAAFIFFPKDSRENSSSRAGSIDVFQDVVRVTWRFTFEWIPGGDCVGDPSTHIPASSPWWMPLRLQNKTADDTDIPMVTHPYNFLPLHLLAACMLLEEDPGYGSSEVVSSRGWPCSECGKLNVQRNICRQACSHCKVCSRQSIASHEAHGSQLTSKST